MKRAALLAILALGVAGTANAEFNYNFVQVSYGQVDFDDLDVDGDSLGLSGSFALTNEFHLFAGAEFADLDFGVDATAWAAGFGYNTAITPVVDVVAQLSFQSVDVDTPFGSADDTGFGLSVGLRYALTQMVELNAGINYVDLDDSGDTTGRATAALFNVTDKVTLGIAANFDDDADSIGVLGRLYF